MKLTRLSVFLISLFFISNASAAILFTDLAGRQVSLDAPATRFVMSEGRYLTTMAILHPENPVEGLVGMLSSVGWTNPHLEKQLFQKFPEARDIALFGSKEKSSVSVEKIIDLKPQVAVFGIQDHGPGAKNSELIDQLTSAGIKIVFIDFRMDPLNNTERSIEILGKVFAAEENANRYLKFYRQKLDAIKTKVATAQQRPKVFLQAHVGLMPCCRAMADGMLGPFIELVGGHNIADAVAPGPTSHHTAEFLLVENPDVWIGTASGLAKGFSDKKNPLALGPGMSKTMAQQSLLRNLKSAEFQALSAIQNGRAHSIWHNFYNSPMNIIAVEAFAKWIHPELFTDLDPDKTMQTLFDEFLPFEREGVYTATLEKP